MPALQAIQLTTDGAAIAEDHDPGTHDVQEVDPKVDQVPVLHVTQRPIDDAENTGDHVPALQETH